MPTADIRVIEKIVERFTFHPAAYSTLLPVMRFHCCATMLNRTVGSRPYSGRSTSYSRVCVACVSGRWRSTIERLLLRRRSRSARVGVPVVDFVCAPDTVMRYDYNFGDDWEHSVRLLSVEPREVGQKYPCCTAGEHVPAYPRIAEEYTATPSSWTRCSPRATTNMRK